MDQLRRQVARARRRLILDEFFGRLVWCMLGALSLAAVALAAPRIVSIATLPDYWDMAWLVGALGIGALAAVLWTVATARTPLDAAIEIDRRFDLRERVASSLSLSSEDRATDVGRAVMNDAVRAVGRIDVDDKFRLRLGRRAWLPLVPAAIAFALVMFVEPRSASSNIERQDAAKFDQQRKTAADSARKKIEEQRKKATEERDLEAARLFQKIEEGMKELSDKKGLDRVKTQVKLNDLAKQLEERQQQLGGKDGLKEQFQSMKNLGAGPAQKAAEALKEGDWKKTLDEVQKLAKDLQAGKLDKEAQERLAKQLEEMQRKLQQTVQAHQQTMDDLKQQIDRERQQGNLAKASELQQKLDQLSRQQQQMKRLQQMAQQMGQAQQALQQGDSQKAAAAMGQLAQQLQEVQQQTSELDMLNAAMAQLEMAKDAMTCSKCNGEGCEECQGMGDNGLREQFDGKPGRGMGRGVGIGTRPEERNATNVRDTQVKQKSGKGAAVFSGMVEGPNIKGEVQQSIQEEMTTLNTESADPVTTERLSKSRREQAKEYFGKLRTGS